MTTNKIKRIKEKVKSWLPAIAGALPLAFLSTACVADSNEACPEEEPVTRFSYTLRLNLHAYTPTRSYGDLLVGGTTEENYIGISEGDYKIVIYDSNGSYLIDYNSEDFENFKIGSDYWIEKFIDKETISENEKILYDALVSHEKIQMMVLANWNNFGEGINYPVVSEESNPFKSSDDNISDLNWTISKSQEFTYLLSDGNSWRPDLEGSPKQFMPMFGLAEAYYQKEPQGATYAVFSQIPMIRALAKIEILDNIKEASDKGESIDAKIKSVTLSYYSNEGVLIPDITKNTSWNNNDIQIIYPTLTDKQGNNSPQVNFLSNYKLTDNENSGFVLYIPEMDLRAYNEESKPYLDIILEIEGVESKSRLELADYQSNAGALTIKPWNYILRNHIYRYIVNSVNVMADLTVEVKEWSEVPMEEFDFSNNVGFVQNGYLKWSGQGTETHDESGIDGSVEYLILKFGDIAKGSFQLQSPVGMQYDIVLTTKSGVLKAFKFVVDENGNDFIDGPKYSLTGNIPNGQPIEFYITPVNETVNNNINQALMQVLIHLSNGDIVTAGFNDRESEGATGGAVSEPLIIQQNMTAM